MSDYERAARRERLDALRASGIAPYPARTGPHESVARVRERFEHATAEELEAQSHAVAVVGRIMAVRSFGKLVFLQLLQDGARIQVSARKQEMEPAAFDFVRKQVDVGDFVRVEGVVWRTKKDELTVDARAVGMLAKTLRPLPEKWHGLGDVEARFRQR